MEFDPVFSGLFQAKPHVQALAQRGGGRALDIGYKIVETLAREGEGSRESLNS